MHGQTHVCARCAFGIFFSAVAALPVPMAIETPSTQDANMQARLDALDAEEESIPAEESLASPEADLKHRLSALNAN